MNNIINKGSDFLHSIEKIVVDHSFDGLSLIDKDGTCLYINEAASNICRFPVHKFIGTNVKDALKNAEFVIESASYIKGFTTETYNF